MANDQKKKKTRKERFLGEMDAVLPWDLLFEQTKRYLSDRGMMVSEGTIVDATIIHAPSSTKNK